MGSYNFVEALSAVSMSDVFNPWADTCPVADRADAAEVRRSNLAIALKRAAELRVRSVLVGRDLGYRGGRRTGLALTDEPHLDAFSRMYGGVSLRRATRGPIVGERTAAMFWDIIGQVNAPVFTWNVFPYHPHEPTNSLSNRCHTSAERRACRWVLIELLELLQPDHVIAVGNDAEAGLLDIGVKCTKVRHPSYGGKNDFVKGMVALHPGMLASNTHPEVQERLL